MENHLHKKKRLKKGIAFLTVLMYVLVIICSGSGTAYAYEEIYNQCGMTYSGTITGNPLSDKTYMIGYDNWPEGFEHIKEEEDYWGRIYEVIQSFHGAVYDGENIWMIPYKADSVIKVNKKTGEMTRYNDWPEGVDPNHYAKFRGGIYDGENIWMIPTALDKVVKINKNTGKMTAYDNWPEGFSGSSSDKFSGGIYDGENIWMIPSNADRVIKIDKETGEMTGYNHWPEGFRKMGLDFYGGVYDGENIWMISRYADRVIKINKETGEMTGYNNWPEGFIKGFDNPDTSFAGGIYDGESIWMIPQHADRVIKINKETGEMTGYTDWPERFTKGDYAFYGGVYDGKNIWMIPARADRVIKIDKETGEMTEYNNWPEGFIKQTEPSYYTLPLSFYGGVYDGADIWMIPRDADRLIKIASYPFVTDTKPAKNAINVPLKTNRISIDFNKEIQLGENIALLSIEDSHQNVLDYVYEAKDNTLVLKLLNSLDEDTIYTVTLPEGSVVDNGYKEAQSETYTFSFATGNRPYVKNTTPKDEALGILVNTDKIDIEYSKPILPSENILSLISIIGDNHTKETVTSYVYDHQKLTLNLDGSLDDGTMYTVMLPEGTVTDSVYNDSIGYTFDFTTKKRSSSNSGGSTPESSNPDTDLKDEPLKHRIIENQKGSMQNIELKILNKEEQDRINNQVVKAIKELGLSLLGVDVVNIQMKAQGDRVENNDAQIQSFSEPIELTMDLLDKNLTDDEIKKLCAVRYEIDDSGNVMIVKYGGTYDKETKSFRYYTDKPGIYSVVNAEELLTLELTINNNRISVNENLKETDVAPVIINNRTMVPLRFIAESFGAKVDWIEETRKVVIEYNGTKLEMVVDELLEDFDTPPTIANGRTLVPLRYISEKFGANILWFSESKKVYMVK